MVENARSLEERIGVEFHDRQLLQQALMHRSFANENPQWGVLPNERLEFLGDALLDYLAADLLFHRFPDMQEGEMTALRSALVKTESLASLAMDWDIGSYLYLGRGEEASGGRARPANLCAAFEALVGALYLDKGIECVRQLITPLLEAKLDFLLAETASETGMNEMTIKDPKSRLQELVQSRYHLTPSYRTVETRGPDHDKEFTVEVLVGREVWGRGIGRSKQAAEQAAAEIAYEALSSEPEKDGMTN